MHNIAALAHHELERRRRAPRDFHDDANPRYRGVPLESVHLVSADAREGALHTGQVEDIESKVLVFCELDH